ncbi:AAA family ATPase [Sulfuracidifex metallicus]|uniref:AAA family ATPase n=1 Tax=Sulfuracidifex metallicus TaxID=47303 RepID=UPI00227650B3|nr:AAA family ATPase [Sulfuracidifex metallicus]MCY0850374.1 AAA family ATPase [Sulfuracidifex metallicus]
MDSDLHILTIYSTKRKAKGVAALGSSDMKRLALLPGDVVIVYGQRIFPFTVMESRDKGVGMEVSEEDLKELGVNQGEKVMIKKVVPKELESVSISPSVQKQFDDRKISLELRGKPIMMRTNINTKEGDFVVVSMSPKVEVGLITGDTKVIVTSPTLRFTQKDISFVTLDEVGGLSDQLSKLMEIAEIALLKPEIPRLFGLRAPKGVLLYGPPGTGKTLIAKALANSMMSSFFYISGPEIASKYFGESEKRLREIFDQALHDAPSIVFIDEVDAMAPGRDVTASEADRRIVAQLLTLMDGVNSRSGVLVIGATNRPNAIDPALRRPGRFDREIEISVPGNKERLEILKIHTKRLRLAEDVDLEKIAGITHGYVGADLEAVVREAALNALKRETDYEKVIVNEGDFMTAIKSVQPSALREFRLEIPNTTWEDVVGLEDVKLELKEVVEWPLKNRDLYDYMKAEIPSGILLYGPPGTGKTLLARAVSHESGANFIAVNGPELLNMWVGESERAIREVFKKARQYSPTVVFFDEIDSLATARGTDPNRVTERIVSQLLTEMDGISKRDEQVVVIAATNRPDILDLALLRPGRLEKLIYVSPPDEEGRKKLFAYMVCKHIHDQIDYERLARLSSMYTPADIRGVVNRGVLLAIRRSMMEGVKPVLIQEDLEKALSAIKPSINQQVLSYYSSFREKTRQSAYA